MADQNQQPLEKLMILLKDHQYNHVEEVAVGVGVDGCGQGAAQGDGGVGRAAKPADLGTGQAGGRVYINPILIEQKSIPCLSSLSCSLCFCLGTYAIT